MVEGEGGMSSTARRNAGLLCCTQQQPLQRVASYLLFLGRNAATVLLLQLGLPLPLLGLFLRAGLLALLPYHLGPAPVLRGLLRTELLPDTVV